MAFEAVVVVVRAEVVVKVMKVMDTESRKVRYKQMTIQGVLYEWISTQVDSHESRIQHKWKSTQVEETRTGSTGSQQ